MKWFKVETNDILFGGYENWQIVAIVKYKALAAQLEHEPDNRQMEKFLTKKEQNFIRNLSGFYQNSVEKTINSRKKIREVDLKRKSKYKELSKNSAAESTAESAKIPQIKEKEKNTPDPKENKNKIYIPHIPEGMLPPKGDTNTPEEKNPPEKLKKFIPPTVEEVSAYCLERDNAVDAGKFVDFYACKGWMVGKNKMKDWRAAVRTWEKDTPKKEQHTIGDWL